MEVAARKREQVADLLHSASIHLLRRAHEQDGASGLSRARLSALSVVVFRGPLTLGALAAAEGVRSATMTGIVTGLQDLGLVRRTPHDRDRRAVLIECTPTGEQALSQARSRRIDAVAQRLDGLDDDDLAVLARAGELLEERFALRPWRPLDRVPERDGG